MNYKKWQDRADAGDISPLTGLAKLTEEVGEVGKAINEQGTDEILEELRHVEFIAMCLRISLLAREAENAERS